LAEDVWNTTALLDTLGLYTTEAFQKNREALITRQQQELLELSAPVVQLWQGVLALPLIGALDSARTGGDGKPAAADCGDRLVHRHH
jgi:rsbT co-antagonist protein RsbR